MSQSSEAYIDQAEREEIRKSKDEELNHLNNILKSKDR